MDKESRPDRRQQEKADLIAAFREQIQSLTLLNKLYDEGHYAIAKEIAVKLRVLLYTGKGRNKALIKTLKLEHIPFADYSAPYNSKNILAHHGLVSLLFSEQGAVYHPVLSMLPTPRRYDDYSNWWSERIVIKDNHGTKFSRQKLVLEVADTDGGAHVDEGLEPDYHKLSRENSLGWTMVDGNGSRTPLGNPVPASIRQISHEVIVTFENVDLEKSSKLH